MNGGRYWRRLKVPEPGVGAPGAPEDFPNLGSKSTRAAYEPRQDYGDLRVTVDHEVLPPDDFADSAASEPATAAWCGLVTAFDVSGRVLLIRQPWADGWLEPGGARQPGESLETTAEREARAETPAVARDPGVGDEEITDVQWFGELPENLFNPDHTEHVYHRARETV